jgi:drug/metabolite transporter (DMT)-like permease
MSGAPPSRWALPAALAAVYVIWGSTYLGIAIAVERIPALASAGVRHLAAGAALLAFLRLRGAPWPPLRTWIGALALGFLMLVLGNGLVCVAERHVPSGLTALLLAITPVFTITGGWLRDGRRPTPLAAVGMALGFVGVAVLCAPGSLLAPWWAYGLILVASLAWATGLTISPWLSQAESLPMRTAMQMICGGAMLLLLALLTGERMPSPAEAPRSWLAVLYLAVFGSMVAYTAYLWLQRHASLALATSNAYVNPLVALVLGATLNGEGLTGRIGLGAALVVGAVALITLGSRRT